MSRSDEAAIARAANARNNAAHQQLRFERWQSVRDELWTLLDRLLAPGARVALVGAGSCDDVPLARVVERAGHVDLIDFDPRSTARARDRLDAAGRRRVEVITDDVTGGCADLVLQAVRDGDALPDALPLPYGALGGGGYDLVVGDMLYTQLLHAGLIALGVLGERQHQLMRRYDPPLVNALVQRIQASLAPGGHAVHVHDLACWSAGHAQPITVDEALDEPDATWKQLLRHDDCDPHLVLGRLHADVVAASWWRWPFEPNKTFLVRASLARAGVGSGSDSAAIFTFR